MVSKELSFIPRLLGFFRSSVPGGSGAMRLREARERSLLYKKIDEIDAKLIPSIKRISKKYNETVTFQNRPYIEKMKYDRVEMLYYLQEERKVNAIHYEAARLGIPLLTQYLDLENLPSKTMEEDSPSAAQVPSSEMNS
ncbi:uncharacterized protein LOC106877538 [Octopus bimaculoides]|nr:uncharacterized protein LOC106877538 [Octopus bimaculoides]